MEGGIVLANIKITLELDNLLLSSTNKEIDTLKTVLELEEVTSINNLLERIGLERNLIGFAAINGVRKELNCILQNKDTIALFPYVIGG